MKTNIRFGLPSEDTRRFAKRFASPYDSQKIEITFKRLQEQMRAPVRSWSARSLAVAIMLNDFPGKDARELLDTWEKVVFRIFGLCRENAQTEQKAFCQLIREILKKDLSPDDILQRIHKIGSNYTYVDTEEEELYDVDRYTGWRDELRYLLCRYEEHLAEKYNQPLSSERQNCIRKFSIEHILPQTADSRLIHALGNLMLLPRGLNSGLSNKNPKQKVDAYRNTKLFSAVEVADWIVKYGGTEPGYEDWHEPCIATRTNTLLSWIVVEFCDV